MNRNIKLTFLGFLISFTGFSQIGIGTVTPDASSALDIFSTEKGFLMPRMSSVQKDGIIAAAEGLQVYDTNTKSVWTFDGTQWIEGVGSAGKFIDGATSEIAYYEGKVGIGINNFGGAHKLYVQGTKNTDEVNTVVNIIADYGGTGTSVSTHGLAATATNSSTGTIDLAIGMQGIVRNNIAGGSMNTGAGTWSQIFNTGNIGYGSASISSLYNENGTITIGIGSVSEINNLAGSTITYAYISDFVSTNYGAITNLYGSYFEYYGTGTVTNSYAIYIENNFNKGMVDNYAIYSDSDADSFLTGNVGFGVISPQRKVHLNDALRLEPQAAPPASGAMGDLYVNVNGKLYFHNGTTWKEVQLVP